MRPLDLEVLAHRIVRHSFLTRHIVTVTDVEVAREMVAPYIFRLGTQRPSTFGVDVTEDLHVHIIVDGEIDTTVAEVQTSGEVITKSRHDDSAGIGVGNREEAEGDCQRQRHVANDHIGRTGGNIITGFHFRFGHLEVEMRMLMVVASGVLTTRHHHLVLLGFLGSVGNDIALTLLRHHMADITFLGFDVIGHLVGFVAILSVLEDRLANPFVFRGVIDAMCIDEAAIQVHADILRGQLHVFVLDLTLTVQIGVTVAGHDHRVRGLIVHRSRDAVLFLDPAAYAVRRDRVWRNRVIGNLIRQSSED